MLIRRQTKETLAKQNADKEQAKEISVENKDCIGS